MAKDYRAHLSFDRDADVYYVDSITGGAVITAWNEAREGSNRYSFEVRAGDTLNEFQATALALVATLTVKPYEKKE